MFLDNYVLNGRGHGPVAEMVQGVRFDPGLLRPMVTPGGRRYVVINSGRKVRDDKSPTGYRDEKKAYWIEDLKRRGIESPAFNAQALPKEVWIELDTMIHKATRQRLRAWSDLVTASPRGGFDAMSRMTLEYQSMNDPGFAVVDMDGLSEGLADAPVMDIKSVPLPITHSDFWFSKREIAISRNGGAPLDTTMAETAGRRVAETIEQTTIGTITGVTYGTRSGDAATAHTGSSAVYGYTNFPYRVTKTDLTTPTGSNPDDVVADVIEMRETMYTNGYYGPFMLYTSTNYDQWLDRAHFVGTFAQGLTSQSRTLREAIRAIEGIQDVRRLDYLTSGYQMVLVQMTSDVCQGINGMDITTVQWESQGGWRQNYKVLAIQVPLLKMQYTTTKSGIIHGTTS